MTLEELLNLRDLSANALCVGIDPDPSRMPNGIAKTPSGVVQFVQEIIQATKAHCVAYKVNFAFFEALGRQGWDALYAVRAMLPEDRYLIADAKRGDVGHTAARYAASILGDLKFDAVTLNTYMGSDVYDPFLAYTDATVIVLALTSNPSHQDFQLSVLPSEQPLYASIMKRAMADIGRDRLMFVVGGTHHQLLEEAMAYADGHALLIPGFGAQGGDLSTILEACDRHGTPGLINSSRGIIYASDGDDYAHAAGKRAAEIADRMRAYLA